MHRGGRGWGEQKPLRGRGGIPLEGPAHRNGKWGRGQAPWLEDRSEFGWIIGCGPEVKVAFR